MADQDRPTEETQETRPAEPPEPTSSDQGDGHAQKKDESQGDDKTAA